MVRATETEVRSTAAPTPSSGRTSTDAVGQPSVLLKPENGLKEGLAQSYTERVLSQLERCYGGALKAYRTMLTGQPEAYRPHTSWEDYSPEAVRRGMLEVRRWNEGKLADFNRRHADAQKELQPENISYESGVVIMNTFAPVRRTTKCAVTQSGDPGCRHVSKHDERTGG